MAKFAIRNGKMNEFSANFIVFYAFCCCCVHQLPFSLSLSPPGHHSNDGAHNCQIINKFKCWCRQAHKYLCQCYTHTQCLYFGVRFMKIGSLFPTNSLPTIECSVDVNVVLFKLELGLCALSHKKERTFCAAFSKIKLII